LVWQRSSCAETFLVGPDRHRANAASQEHPGSATGGHDSAGLAECTWLRGETRARLKQIIRDHEDGVAVTVGRGFTVAEAAVNDWLDHGLSARDPNTVAARRSLASNHVIPALGARKLIDLSAEDVDQWLAEKARMLSTRTLQDIKSILSRSITRAQAHAVVEQATGSTMGAYVLLSLLTGARTEELRVLTWSHVDLAGSPSTPSRQFCRT
jgi:hypothetical protein